MILSSQEISDYISKGGLKIWVERRNLEPLAEHGQVAYFFRPQSKKYPPSIYVFIHWEKWRDRNLRAMGLMGQRPFLTRTMSVEEIKERHFDTRMKYYQYKSWQGLINDESDIAGEEFVKKLRPFIAKFPEVSLSLKANNRGGELVEEKQT